MGFGLLDEVDNMLLDNAGHTAKLSENIPGMHEVSLIYTKIWYALISEVERLNW